MEGRFEDYTLGRNIEIEKVKEIYRLFKKLKCKPNKIMGMAGVLDSSRYKYFVAREANVSVENVEAVVLGGHGDTMVPIRSACRIYGLPVEQ